MYCTHRFLEISGCFLITRSMKSLRIVSDYFFPFFLMKRGSIPSVSRSIVRLFNDRNERFSFKLKNLVYINLEIV